MNAGSAEDSTALALFEKKSSKHCSDCADDRENADGGRKVLYPWRSKKKFHRLQGTNSTFVNMRDIKLGTAP
jgi:hypothetical protein